ncbi:MAG: CD225/dispanin family protein [Prevotella sp.]|jgi:hypothetical protein
MDYNQNMMQKPDNYLVWAILTTICCCLPFGIVSIVYACKVNSLFYSNQYELAYDASKKAKNWAIAAACTGLVVNVVYGLVWGFANIAEIANSL